MIELMEAAKRPAVPNGARSVQVREAIFEFCADKILAISRLTREHYTLHTGRASGILDVHRTEDARGGGHRTILAIRHEDLAAILEKLAWVPVALLGLFRPLRVGWLARHGLGIVRGLNPSPDEEIAAATRRRSGRLIFDEALCQRNLQIPEYLEEVWKFPDGVFSILDRRTMIGIGFKKTSQSGHARLYWIKVRDLKRFGVALEHHLTNELSRRAIPPSAYNEYPLLTP